MSLSRRSFFKSLGIATAMLYVRFAPSTAAPATLRAPDIAPISQKWDDSVHCYGNLARHKGRVMTLEQMFEWNRMRSAPRRAEFLAQCPEWHERAVAEAMKEMAA